ncbi:MAG: hypothetical protein WBA46_01495 [Thermomicrobiales bacterium]
MLARRFLVIAGVFLSLLMASTSLVAAQREPDVKAIGDAVSSANQKTLIADLETPMKARELPKGFTDATYVDISSSAKANAEDCMYDASSVKVTGAVGYLVTTDPDVVSYPYTCASINYLAFNEKDMGKDPLGDFKEGVLSGLDEANAQNAGTPESESGAGKVTDVTVAGEDAILITYTLEQGGAHVVVQTLAIPVGNYFVVALVSVGDSTQVDEADVETLVNDLTVAAIEHLGAVADTAQ